LFQSSPGLVTGRYVMVAVVPSRDTIVSILARSGDRALRAYLVLAIYRFMFQSSPGLVTGRYLGYCRENCRWITFQSSPGLVTGRYHGVVINGGAGVAFQSSPGLVTGRYRL